MADKAARFSENLPLSKKLNFILPYATFHESRVNWRPLMFSKFFGCVNARPALVAHHSVLCLSCHATSKTL